MDDDNDDDGYDDDDVFGSEDDDYDDDVELTFDSGSSSTLTEVENSVDASTGNKRLFEGEDANTLKAADVTKGEVNVNGQTDTAR